MPRAPSPMGLKYKELLPAWGMNYSLLQPGLHDGPIAGLCCEGLPYFLNGATNCDIRDDQSAYNGPSHCLNPSGAETSITQCVNTVENDTIHSGRAIISTMPPAGTAGDRPGPTTSSTTSWSMSPPEPRDRLRARLELGASAPVGQRTDLVGVLQARVASRDHLRLGRGRPDHAASRRPRRPTISRWMTINAIRPASWRNGAARSAIRAATAAPVEPAPSVNSGRPARQRPSMATLTRSESARFRASSCRSPGSRRSSIRFSRRLTERDQRTRTTSSLRSCALSGSGDPELAGEPGSRTTRRRCAARHRRRSRRSLHRARRCRRQRLGGDGHRRHRLLADSRCDRPDDHSKGRHVSSGPGPDTNERMSVTIMHADGTSTVLTRTNTPSSDRIFRSPT